MQNILAAPDIPEIEIPVEPVTMESLVEEAIEEEELERTVDYTEDLWEITDVGIYDIFGAPQEQIEEPVEEQIEEPVVESDDPFEEYRQSIIESWGGKKAFAEKRTPKLKKLAPFSFYPLLF